jgi:ankyrin repeat protein
VIALAKERAERFEMSSDSAEEVADVCSEEVCPSVCSPHYIYGTDAEEAQEGSGCVPCITSPTGNDSKPTYIITHFEAGPLGVTLHWRPEDGIVEISGIIPDTQATNMEVHAGDELWAVGSLEMGSNFIEKEAWQGIVDYIKQSDRPLEVTWKRPHRRNPSLAGSPRSTILDESIQVSRERAESGTSPRNASRDGEGRQDQVTQAVTEEAVEESEQAPVVSPNFKMLETVLSSLVKKPAHGKDNYKNEFHYRYLLKEDRRLLKRGELTVHGGTTLWIKTYHKKHVILLSDMLIITTPHMVHKVQCYVVDHMIDLQTCKLRSDGQVFGGGAEGKSGPANPVAGSASHAKDKSHGSDKQALECAFQVIWPGGSMQLFADSKEAKEVWVLNLFLAICARVAVETNGQGLVLGWRHQYMLGTMHSAVVGRDEAHVRELIALCDAGEMEFSACIDAVDEDGYTPLHYACIMRLHGIIRALHEAAADVTAPDHRGLTPLHWAAMQLDDYTLSLLCSHVFDLDLCDKQQRTPLYMACVEGRDVSGRTDTVALKQCVACMLTHQPNVHFYDQHGYNLVHYLAASWQYEALELLLQAEADPNARAAKLGMASLHLACLAQPLKRAEGEAKRIIQGDDPTVTTNAIISGSGKGSTGGEDARASPVFEKIHHPMGSTTLRTLLKAGARPNMRDSQGRTPLHILAEPGRDDLWDLMELTDGVAVLVSFGARFDDSVALQGLKSRLIGVSVEALVERWASLPVINGDTLNLT